MQTFLLQVNNLNGYSSKIILAFALLVSFNTTAYGQCTSTGDDSDGYTTGIRQVIFNTIDNTSPSEDNDYSDYTSISTTVGQTATYNLTVTVDTDGNYTNHTFAWIDWNQDLDFDDSGESFDLGTARNVTSGATSSSPLSITVPATATLGSTIMRVSTKYNSDPSSCENGFDGEVEDYTVIVTVPPTPEIDVVGNGLSIYSGDTSPSITDDTYFGNADLVTGTVTNSFTIDNTGDATLNLDGSPVVAISGAAAADFSIVSQPAASVSPAGNVSFDIEFDPSATGSRIATVSIDNDDNDEDPFTFNIQGNGTVTPEIDIYGNGVLLVDGATSTSVTNDTDFGNADLYGGANQHTFTISNPGSGDLTLYGGPSYVQTSGAHAADFIVSAQPAGTISGQGGSETFIITFNPSSAGLRQATVSLSSNDGDESPFTFVVQGTGTINPEIDIKGNGVTIADGDMLTTTTDSTNFGSTTVGDLPHIVTFTIYNTGEATLNLTGSWPLIEISGIHSGDFSVSSAPSSSVAPGSSTTFQIAFDPITSGTRTATLTIDNNDLNEGSYSFAIQGTGAYDSPPDSDIEVRGNLVLISDGSSTPGSSNGTDFGSVAVDGATQTQTFSIKNNGTEDLVLTANPLVSVSGVNASEFTVTQQPSSPVAPNATVTFVVSFDPAGGSNRNATIVIENNDANKNPYDFAIQGTGLTAPEISVTGNGVDIVDGDNTPVLSDSTFLGSVTASLGTGYVTYTIHNTGSSPLNISDVSILIDSLGEFSISTAPSSSIPANGSSDLIIAFDPNQVGDRPAGIAITSDDADEAYFDFAIRGSGTGPGSPISCAPNFFHIYGDDGTIAYLDATTNPYTYSTIAVAGYSINGLGYNMEDGLIYGFEMDNDVSGDKIVRIDGAGNIQVLDVSINYESYRADFNESGELYFWNSSGTQVGIFDASSGSVSYTNVGGTDWEPIDMAYLSSHEKFYGVHTRTLYIYDPVANSVSTQLITGRLADEYATGTNSIYYGACWTAYDGYLYTTNSQSGRMYKINVENYVSVYVGQAEANLNKSDGASCPLAEAPLPSTGTVGGIAWIDTDMDGIQDDSEAGLAGVTVSIATTDDSFINSVTTGADGSYQFQNLSSADYYVTFSSPPTGFSLTNQDEGSNDLLDSDADETSGETDPFFVLAGLIEEGVDAGYIATGLGNLVWNDTDGDGVQDLNEDGVPGVTVTLRRNSANVATTTTNANGQYFFTNVTPNSGYSIRISNLPGGFQVSPQNQGGDDALDSDVSTGSPYESGTYTLDSGEFISTVDAGINQNSTPEMNVQGNSTNIADGDNTPASADSTEFGSVSAASGTVTVTYTIQNLSGADLTLNGTPVVAIGGPHASDFTVTSQPASTNISSGNNTTFHVTFDPSALGLRSAYVSISNSDPTSNPYDFNIQGTGLAPEIVIKGDGLVINSGDNTPNLSDDTDLGEADIQSGVAYSTFTIVNTGSSTLNLTGSDPYLTVSGTHSADFSIDVAPDASISAGDSTTFLVGFDPGAEGLRTATLSLANNDADENPYTFDIQGTGTSYPEIELRGGAVVIADGDNTPSTADRTDFGDDDIISGQTVKTFTIRNTGSGVLHLTGSPLVQITGVNAGDFVVTQQPDPDSVLAGGTVDFQVTFNPTTTGVRQATIFISSDDNNENPYNFAVKGLGTSTLDEEMEVLGNDSIIVSGDTSPRSADFTDLGEAEISGVPANATFVIRNVGYAVLSLTGPPPYVAISGPNAAEFSITSSPSIAVGIDSATTSFEVSFTPSGLGTRSATLSIQNDDADENPYTFDVQGSGVYDPHSLSEILVDGNMITIPDADETPNSADGTDFGSVEVVGGYTATQEFVIHNIGTDDDLVLGSTPMFTFTGTNAGDFSVVAEPASLVAPNSSVAFTVSFDPSGTGLREATVVIGNSDPDHNPYTFDIQGTGTISPEISVLGNDVIIASGDDTPGTSDSTDFGDVDVALGQQYITYTIENIGSATLSLTGNKVEISGVSSSDFSVSTMPTASIGMGSSTSFVIKFDALVVGTREATISIFSDDPNTPTYTFDIEGNGTGSGIPFTCAPNFFVVYGSNGTIATLDASTYPYTYTTIATAGYVIDGIAYNVQDGLIYGFEHYNSGWPRPENMVRIDATGEITTLDAIDHSFASEVADFDNDGNYYFWDATGTDVRKFDATAGTVTGDLNPSGTFAAQDMAFRNSDEIFYGVHGSTLYSYDPDANSVSTKSITGKLSDDLSAGTNGNDYPSAWAADDPEDGDVIYVTNETSGRMYKLVVDGTTATSVFVGTATVVSNSDGASCPISASPLPTTGTIGNFVWLDSDGDGRQDAGETGLAGVTVSLYGVGNPTALSSVVTTDDGAYTFSSLSAGQYYLTFTTPPTGFSLSDKDVGSDDDIDSDVDTGTLKSDIIDITPAIVDNSIDAGFKATGVGDYVWLDVDEDGEQDVGETTGVPGIQVIIKTDPAGVAVDTTITDANGFYSFTGLSAVQYKLYFSGLAAGYTFSPQDQGGDDDLDSDVNASGVTDAFTLSPGSFDTALDVGVYQQSTPEINVRGNNMDIVDGDVTPSTADHTDFGSVNAVVDSVLHTFQIVNVSGAELTLNGSPRVSVSGTHAGDFIVKTQPAATVTAPDSTSFVLRFIPLGEGLRTASITIANTDDNENPYNFNVRGFGLASEIHVTGGNHSISDGDVTTDSENLTYFGTEDISTGSQSHIFSILNTGNSNLVLTDPSPHLTITGPDSADFSIASAPVSPIASNASTPFTITFDPSEEGLRTATISISSNDNDENPYTFVIEGVGSAVPEVELLGNDEGIANGDMTPSEFDSTDFGSRDILTDTRAQSFSIVNSGSGTLTLTGMPAVELGGTHAGDFLISAQPAASSVAAGDTLDFEVTFNPTSVGLRTATVSIASDDSDENPFTFAIQGTGVASSEIDVLGNGISIANGDLMPSVLDSTFFDSTIIDSAAWLTFTIQNQGSAALNLSGASPYVSLSGDDASDFSVTTIPSNIIAAGGGTTTFRITFTPSEEGDREAVVSISSDDDDENPFTFAIQGYGLPTPQPELTLVETVDLAIAAPGDTLTYEVIYNNVGVGLATSVVIDQEVPDKTTYVTDSAAGTDMTITYSHDGGTIYNTSQDAPVTDIRFQLTTTLASGANGTVTFKVSVD